MRAGVFAKTFAAQGALNSLRAVRDAGFAAAQFNFACLGMPSMPDAISEGAAREIAEASATSGVAISAISATYNMAHPDKRVRAAGLHRLAGIIGAARGCGVALVTLCTGTRDAEDMWRAHPDNGAPEAWRDLIAEMAKAAALAEAAGVALGIEPELANVVASAEAARRLIDELASPAIRVVLDPANLFEREAPERRRRVIASAIDLLADRIALAHAKDRDAEGGLAPAGRGVIDFAHFIARLRAAGFDGDLIAHGLSEGEAPEVASFLAQAIAA